MKAEEVKIELNEKRQKVTSTLYVEQLGENHFRMVDNAIMNCRLTLGKEFRTRVNQQGQHEIIEITKESDFITRRFFLSPQYKESDYRMLGDELIKRGGFWQVDFGSMATINLPKDFEYDVDQVMKELGLKLTEIIDDEE
jgi:hypothetical protein